MYKVIEAFPDAQDNSYIYNVGDTYPRDGVKPSKERISELSGDRNSRQRPLIAETEETKRKATSEKKGA